MTAMNWINGFELLCYAITVRFRVYWLAMYGFCIAALIYLDIAAEKPVYFTAGILFGLGTLAPGMLKEEKDKG